MDKIVFKHNKSSLPRALGVDPSRAEEIQEAVKMAIIDNEDSRKSTDLEAIVNDIEPETAAEYLLVGFYYSEARESLKEIMHDHKERIKGVVGTARKVLDMLEEEAEKDDEEKPKKPKKKLVN